MRRETKGQREKKKRKKKSQTGRVLDPGGHDLRQLVAGGVAGGGRAAGGQLQALADFPREHSPDLPSPDDGVVGGRALAYQGSVSSWRVGRKLAVAKSFLTFLVIAIYVMKKKKKKKENEKRSQNQKKKKRKKKENYVLKQAQCLLLLNLSLDVILGLGLLVLMIEARQDVGRPHHWGPGRGG